MIPKSNMPHFFYDDGTQSHETEIMIDFFISWTIRCSVDKFKDENSLVQEYSKDILLFLLKDKLKGFSKEDIEIKKVDTWKQWEKIDLIADVEIDINGKTKKYVIVFENKLYTHIHDNQLNRYIQSIKTGYKGKGFEEVYIFLTASDVVSAEDRAACNAASEKFRPLTVFDLRESFGDVEESTGNYLFDEFWFKYFFYDRGKEFTPEYLKVHFEEGTF